jgi:hypothetical protein
MTKEHSTVIASEAKQSSFTAAKLDCFVASLLAMTVVALPPVQQPCFQPADRLADR